MKVPCCSVCHSRYDEEERVPLLLHCGHGFCKACLSRMFAAATETSISCPRCRHPTVVGNSVHALRKNFPILSLLTSSASFDCDFTDDDDDDPEEGSGGGDYDDDDEEDYLGSRSRRRRNRQSRPSVSGCCSANGGTSAASCTIDLVTHQDLKLLKRLGEGRRAGHEMWSAVLSRSSSLSSSSSSASSAAGTVSGRCRHQVAVKKVVITDDMDVVWVQSRLESLHRASMWCRNVCTFHGATRMNGHLCLVMDRYNGSIKSVMEQNNGRLTLEQILRYGADIARGVAELHAAGIVCMSLKPSNLLLDENCRAVVSDYGLPEILKKPSCRKAQSSSEECSSNVHSCMDCTMLSPHYTAPEAWEPLKKSLFWDESIGISLESDAWSFGCTLVEMCTGSVPWAGLSPEEIYRAVVKARRLPPQYASVVGVGIPRELWKMIGDCLQFKASKRPTFQAMLSIFLRHLQEIPRSPPASPDKPLHLCIETWNVAVVKRWVEVASQEVIDEAIDIPGPNGTALCMAAALKKDHEIAALLILKPDSILTEGRELVRILLAAGADPTAQDEVNFRTALHTAAMINDAELVKIILKAGVDVNVRNAQNTIPLHVALNRGANTCVGLLLSAGADCNLQDDDGDNAFHIAADAAKMIRENLYWIVVMGWTLRDFLETLPREWISEELMEALADKGVHLSPTIYEVGDWVKFKRSVINPAHGWQGASYKSVGFVQAIMDSNSLLVSFCSGEARVLASEVIKLVPLNRGQHVQLRSDVKEPRFGWRGQSRDSIGTVLCVDDDGILRVGFPGASRGWRADPAEMERVEEFRVGDWVRVRPALTAAIHGMEAVTPGSIGIVYSIRPDSSLLLGLSYLPNPWHCEPEEVEPVEPFRIGDHVCVKRSVAEPRYGWGGETHHSVGKIIDIEGDGLLMVDILDRSTTWQADPSDMEKVENFKVGDWVRVKASVPSPKYGWEDVTRNSIGIIHSLEDGGDMGVAFCFRSKPFACSVADMEKVQPFEVGQKIHVMPFISQPRLGWSNESAATIGTISRIDMDGTLNVRVAGRSSLWKVAPGDAERLSGFEVGDWVRLKPSLGARPTYDWNSIGRESIAVVHSIQDSGYLELAGCLRKGKWITHYMDVEKVPCLKVGQHVRFRTGLVEPRWGWRDARPDSRGIITGVHADGEVRVAFFGVPGLWRGDPADLEKEEMFEVGEWVRLREHVDSWKSLKPGSIGIVHGIGYEGNAWDGTVHVAFCGEQERWVGPTNQLERVDRLVVGQQVRIKKSVKQPRFGWSNHSHASIGTISTIDADGKLRIYTPAGSKAWMIDPAEVDRVEEEEEVRVGDWVKVRETVTTPTYQWGDVSHTSIGVVHKIEDGELRVAFCFSERLWVCKEWEVEKVRAFKVGDKVRVRPGLIMPRWGWGMETFASKGEVMGVDANGKLRIKFKWRDGRLWLGDPADIVLDESSDTTNTINECYS
ncbi:hypothetical protein COCNU_02G017600 [Cocos nucifera]|uniref:RING-type E3 ubiquitin transferase n=1 Tax=Cocos nucifera TaxID=13894 RepID=A0A8K0MXS8_COCNU|nr:hypothetical protein COCNU_02G017600 [Cocos nucifera]